MNVFINKDKVLIVNMELANAIGLNRAIVLNQINYWIEKSNHVFEGKKWIYNSFESWHDQFQFWSLNTVKRIFKSLEKDGLVISGTYNKAAFDKTKWYTIDYDKVSNMVLSMTHDDTVVDPNWDNEEYQNETTNTRDYTETTSESTSFSNTLVDSGESTSVEDEKEQKSLIPEEEKDKLIKNFGKIYSKYPKKVGKAKAFDYYRQYLKGRKMSTGTVKLTNLQIWHAVKKYVEERESKETELKYYQDFSTFMNKTILDYLEE